MASWMVHLRIADMLLNQIPDLCGTEFVVGNIAPDSGVPDKEWSTFKPSKQISHFKDSEKKADPYAFAAKYFTKEQQKEYSNEQYSFFLGYLVHLLTDRLWSEKIAIPTLARFADALEKDKRSTIGKIKEDWYDLDFLYLKNHPDFRAFSIFENAVGFENVYMEEFSPDAFDNRRAYIVSFYREVNNNLIREYPYLTEEEAERFTVDSANEILQLLKLYCI